MDFMITSIDDVSRQVHYSINKVGNKYAVRALFELCFSGVMEVLEEVEKK